MDIFLFLTFDRPIHLPPAEGNPEPHFLTYFDIHINNFFGNYNSDNQATLDIINKLKTIFEFRKWHEGNYDKDLEYYGRQISKIDKHYWKFHDQNYYKKITPITVPKERASKNLPVAEGKHTALRVVIGSLYWPITQTSPYM